MAMNEKLCKKLTNKMRHASVGKWGSTGRMLSFAPPPYIHTHTTLNPTPGGNLSKLRHVHDRGLQRESGS